MRFAAATRALLIVTAVGRVAAQTPEPSSMPSSQPSSDPSEQPSSEPSSDPSEQPSSDPSEQPSSQPSSDPSEQPSSEPSSDPSEQPSSQPSSDPSEQPSSQPSSDPSEQPSSEPSSDPSDQPSLDPSEQPSKSQEPSSAPSSDPSEQPSSEPSEQPSSEPSSMPSCSPSFSPTESPSTKYGTNMFYPIWEQNYNGCRNDGLEPNYMAANPTDWLTSTNEACCSKFFNGFLYEACMGRYPPDHDDCIVALFYPDWSGSNEGCIADGKEPYYMLSNFNYFFSNSIEECCEKFYQWNYYDCTGTSPVLTNGEYYPDWTGSSTAACRNDNKMPTYMLNDQSWYLSTTLEKCCERHFSWGLRDCLGTTLVGTNEWYVNYGDETCVQDCNGASPCGGIADFWVQLYKSKAECCKDALPWKPRCRFN